MRSALRAVFSKECLEGEPPRLLAPQHREGACQTEVAAGLVVQHIDHHHAAGLDGLRRGAGTQRPGLLERSHTAGRPIPHCYLLPASQEGPRQG